MSKRFGLFLVFLMLVSCCVVGPSLMVQAAANPQINANPTISQDDVIVYTHNVLNYGAVADGSTDNTAAFQAAIDDAYACGGGIVYAPAGQYKFTGNLILKRKVTLRGEWRNPDTTGTAAGTILMPYANQGNESGASFITVCSNAGLKNLSIWYPQQSFSTVYAYPWTISDGVFDSDDAYHHGFSVQNVTLYNSYKGIFTGNVSYSQEPRLLNVYGTFLKQGMEGTNCYNFASCTNFYASSKYWINSGLTGAPTASADQTTLINYMRTNLTAITTLAHTDGYMFYNVNVTDANLGLYGDGYWDYYYNINMTNVNKGVYIDGSGNADGGVAQQFIGGNISVLAGTGHYGIEIPNQSQVDIIGVTIGGAPEIGVYGHNGARLNLNQMTFSAWSAYAIKASGTSLQVLDSKFNQPGTHIYLDATNVSAAILGNTWTGTRTISNNCTGTVNIDDTSLGLPQFSTYNTGYTTIPQRKPGNPGNFYNITAYGAVSGGSTDCTTSIQNALNAASAAGGGTVFVPSGYWLVAGTLTIPSGVYLRGISESVGCCDNRGSSLFPTSGQGSPDGTACVTMSANSGIVGISFYYPNIATSRTIQYPPAIRGNGSGLYIRNISVGNAWRGIDLYTNRCDNFEVAGVWGNPRDYGIYVGGGSQNGKLENNMFAWTGDAGESTATAYPNGNTRAYANGGGGVVSTVGRPFVFANSTGVVGFQNYVFCPRGDTNGCLKFVNNGGGPNSLTLIQTIADQAQGFEAQAGGTISILGISNSWGGSWTESTFTGTVNVFGYNASCLDGSNDGLDDNYIWNSGGTINVVCGSSTLRPGNTGLKFDAGTSVIAGLTDCNSNKGRDIVSAAAAITSAKVVGCAAYGPITATNNAGNKLTLSNNIDFSVSPNSSNLALSKTVTASSTVENSDWGAAKAVDGQRSAISGAYGWSSDNSTTSNHTEWVEVDLGSANSITKVDLYPRNDSPNTGYGFPIDFTIQTSTDNSNWTTVVTKTGYALPAGTVQSFTFTATNARYVKVNGTNLRPNPNDGNLYRMQFAEFEVYGSNFALNKTVTASSSVENSDWGAAKAVDGQKSSISGAYGWSSDNSTTSNHTEWVEVDLGSASSISRVDLYPRNDSPNTGYGFPVDFTIQTSPDNSNWTTVVTKTGYALPTGMVQSFTFTASNARYVKVNGTNLRPNPNDGNLYRMQFAEFEVY
jgi:F5/8 type C domain/Pectate lyase superfamily protein